MFVLADSTFIFIDYINYMQQMIQDYDNRMASIAASQQCHSLGHGDMVDLASSNKQMSWLNHGQSAAPPGLQMVS